MWYPDSKPWTPDCGCPECEGPLCEEHDGPWECLRCHGRFDDDGDPVEVEIEA